MNDHARVRFYKPHLFRFFSGERGPDAGPGPGPVRLHGRLPPALHDRARLAGAALQARVHLQLSYEPEGPGQG